MFYEVDYSPRGHFIARHSPLARAEVQVVIIGVYPFEFIMEQRIRARFCPGLLYYPVHLL